MRWRWWILDATQTAILNHYTTYLQCPYKLHQPAPRLFCTSEQNTVVNCAVTLRKFANNSTRITFTVEEKTLQLLLNRARQTWICSGQPGERSFILEASCGPMRLNWSSLAIETLLVFGKSGQGIEPQEHRPHSFIFLLDNHPEHTSLLVKNHLQRTRVNGIPAQSPDFNPIENFRSDLKKNTRRS